MTFTKWKQAMLQDGNFRSKSRAEKAKYIVANSGNQPAALNWAYKLDHAAAWLEEQRCKSTSRPTKLT